MTLFTHDQGHMGTWRKGNERMDEWNEGYLTGIKAGLKLVETGVTTWQENTGKSPTVDTYKATIRMIRKWLARQQELGEIESECYRLMERPAEAF